MGSVPCLLEGLCNGVRPRRSTASQYKGITKCNFVTREYSVGLSYAHALRPCDTKTRLPLGPSGRLRRRTGRIPRIPVRRHLLARRLVETKTALLRATWGRRCHSASIRQDCSVLPHGPVRRLFATSIRYAFGPLVDGNLSGKQARTGRQRRRNEPSIVFHDVAPYLFKPDAAVLRATPCTKTGGR